ncbi:hypothetical protein ABKV19_019509 [Rosa sericea]
MVLGVFSFCPRETRRLLWIVGTMFAVLIVIQHLHPLSYVFSAKKVPVEGKTSFQAKDLPSNVDIVGNVSVSNGFNYTATYAFHKIANTSTSSFVSEESGGLDRNLDTGVVNISVQSNVTSVEKDRTTSSEKTQNSEHTDLNGTGNGSSVTRVPEENKGSEIPILDVYTISDMNKLLHHSRTSYHSVIPQWSSSIDQEIQYAASQIGNAPLIENDPNLYARSSLSESFHV